MGSGTYSVPGFREAMRIGDPESLQNLLSAPDSSVVDISHSLITGLSLRSKKTIIDFPMRKTLSTASVPYKVI